MATEQGESKPLARRALSGAVAAIASIGIDAHARREVVALGIGRSKAATPEPVEGPEGTSYASSGTEIR
jgi:hypothetical protein